MIEFTSSLKIYPTYKMKKSFDTKISELSIDGNYDYLPIPVISVISPNSDTLFVGDKKIISWILSSNEVISSVDLYYILNNKKIHISTVNAISSSYEWKITDDLINTDTYKILISGSYTNREYSVALNNKSIQSESESFLISGIPA